MGRLGAADLAVVAAYLAAAVALGVRSARRPVDRTDDFLLAGRTLTLPAFVASLVTTWYGGVLGVGEYAYLNGLSNWLVMGVPYYVGTTLFAILFARRARQMGDYTIPDVLHGTYGRAAGTLGTLMVLALSLPAAHLLMLGVLLRRATGLAQAWGIGLSAAFCLAYILVRGFRSVVQTKGLQFVLLYGGFLLLLPLAVARSGGLEFLRARTPPEAFTVLGGHTAGYVVAWYFIALQTLVEPTFFQRCFAARTPGVARSGLYASVAFFAIFDGLTTFTGLYARALVPDLPTPVDAFPALGEALLPPLLLGAFYAGMVATLMSTVDSYLFVGGVTVGRDLIWRLSAGRRDAMGWTRIGVVAVAAGSALIAAASSSVVSLWYGFGSVGTAVLLPPLLGAFYPALRPPRAAAAWGMALSGGVTSAWVLGAAASGGRPWLGVEAIYPGLVTAAACHFAGIRRRRREGS